MKAPSEGFLLVQTTGQDSFPSFRNVVFSVIKTMFQPIYCSFQARFPSIIRQNEGLKCPLSQPPSSNHISFIPAQICIGKVSISTVFTPPPHHINHLSGHPFILPLFNKLAAALATAISHSILVGFSSTRRQFQRFLSLFLVVLPV